MGGYEKGSSAERELGKLLWKFGFSVIRSAGSARFRYSAPDVVAAKNGKVLAFECKARKGYVSLKDAEVSELKDWARRAGARGFLAWKINHDGWWFLGIHEAGSGLSESAMRARGTRLENIISDIL